jgi:hypothetical protein
MFCIVSCEGPIGQFWSGLVIHESLRAPFVWRVSYFNGGGCSPDDWVAMASDMANEDGVVNILD